MELWGITGPGADQLRARATAETDIEIWPENLRPFDFFLSLSTQWHRAGLNGTIVGLDYQAAKMIATGRDMAFDGELIADLQACEAGALKAFRARDERRAAEAERERSRRG